jgi:hypothetical protein
VCAKSSGTALLFSCSTCASPASFLNCRNEYMLQTVLLIKQLSQRNHDINGKGQDQYNNDPKEKDKEPLKGIVEGEHAAKEHPTNERNLTGRLIYH